MAIFRAADILLPANADFSKWSVIACDQFTSQPEYWARVEENVGPAPSTLNIILPEAKLKGDCSEDIAKINRTMAEYVAGGVFTSYPGSYVYVERTLLDGSVRHGVVGMIDLEQYDYSQDAVSGIRATERTVLSRIPPRKKIRENAPVEVPHVLLLCDDQEDMLFGRLAEMSGSLPLLYDFDLMEDGGRIRGRLLQGADAELFGQLVERYEAGAGTRYGAACGVPFNYAVGDGNHSLATAKACWEELKAQGADPVNHPARFAMLELVNIHDRALAFEPIHRLLFHVDPEAVLEALRPVCREGGCPVKWHSGSREGVVFIDAGNGELPVAIVQNVLDEWLKKNGGEIDFIHGEDVLASLASEADDRLGLEMPPVAKDGFFRGIMAGGVLPRKTFSMGHAREKRYYMECRAIR